jgi:hypothetical protein
MSIHLRGTDLAHAMAPTLRILEAGITKAERLRLKTIFLGTDDPGLLELAMGVFGREPFTVHHNTEFFSPTSLEGTLNSCAEYLVMATGAAFVGNVKSTFSTEISNAFPKARFLLL